MAPRHPVPDGQEDSTEVLGIPGLRYCGDDIPPKLELRLSDLADDQQIQAVYLALLDKPHRHLTIAGDGAEDA